MRSIGLRSGLDIGEERLAYDAPLDEASSFDAIEAQRGQERQGAPAAIRFTLARTLITGWVTFWGSTPSSVVREEREFQAGARFKLEGELGEDLAQEKLQPLDEAAEVVADGGEDGIGGIALAVPR